MNVVGGILNLVLWTQGSRLFAEPSHSGGLAPIHRRFIGISNNSAYLCFLLYHYLQYRQLLLLCTCSQSYSVVYQERSCLMTPQMAVHYKGRVQYYYNLRVCAYSKTGSRTELHSNNALAWSSWLTPAGILYAKVRGALESTRFTTGTSALSESRLEGVAVYRRLSSQG